MWDCINVTRRCFVHICCTFSAGGQGGIRYSAKCPQWKMTWLWLFYVFKCTFMTRINEKDYILCALSPHSVLDVIWRSIYFLFFIYNHQKNNAVPENYFRFLPLTTETISVPHRFCFVPLKYRCLKHESSSHYLTVHGLSVCFHVWAFPETPRYVNARSLLLTMIVA